MAEVIGGNIPQLETLQAELRRRSSEIQSLRSGLNSNITTIYWKGGAAERFQQAWQGEYSPMLQKLEGLLAELGQEVARRKQALIEVGS